MQIYVSRSLEPLLAHITDRASDEQQPQASKCRAQCRWRNKETHSLSSKSQGSPPPSTWLRGEDVKGKGDLGFVTCTECERRCCLCSLAVADRASWRVKVPKLHSGGPQRFLKPGGWSTGPQSLPPLWCPSPCPHLPPPLSLGYPPGNTFYHVSPEGERAAPRGDAALGARSNWITDQAPQERTLVTSNTQPCTLLQHSGHLVHAYTPTQLCFPPWPLGSRALD